MVLNVNRFRFPVKSVKLNDLIVENWVNSGCGRTFVKEVLNCKTCYVIELKGRMKSKRKSHGKTNRIYVNKEGRILYLSLHGTKIKGVVEGGIRERRETSF